MSGHSLFLDTNILLYLISGDETVAQLLDGKQISISFITELELLGYSDLADPEVALIGSLLKEAQIVDVNPEIKALVIELRQRYKIKLPDAIIAASAIHARLPLVSADKQLAQIKEVNLLLYQV